MTRNPWIGNEGIRIGMQPQKQGTPTTLAYLYAEYPTRAPFHPGSRVPWTPTQDDLMATDWVPAPN